MNMKKAIRTMVVASLLGLNGLSGQVKKGFSALEGVYMPQVQSAEARLYANANARLGPGEISGHEYSSMTIGQPNSYFGNHRICVGTKKIKALAGVKTFGSGRGSEYGGIRYEKGLPGFQYGNTEVTANTKGLGASVLSGASNKYGSLELFVSHNMPFGAKDATLLELQVLAGTNKLQPYVLLQSYDFAKPSVGIGVRSQF
jgi:hypothetical protein